MIGAVQFTVRCLSLILIFLVMLYRPYKKTTWWHSYISNYHFKILPPPRCTYGEYRISNEYSPALRARDYKDPVWVMVIYETN